MRYFLVNLAMHLVFLGILSLLTCIFVARNRARKTKRVAFYFLPVVLALLAVLDLALITAPRLMDISSIVSKSYYYDTGKITDVSFLNNYYFIDGKCYFINPLRMKAKAGDTVRVKHSKYSRFTSEIIDMSNPEANPSDTVTKQ